MRRLKNDDGVSLVLVGVVLVLLLVSAGFAVDLGAIYQERRELRSGADAGALAIAAICATDPASPDCSDSTTAGSPADTYADLNADDGHAAVDEVTICGPGWECIPPSPYTWTVEAWTSAETDTGEPGFPMKFMRIVGRDSVDVRATATAAAGAPAWIGNALPLVISDCEWYRIEDGTWQPGQDVVLYWHDGNQQESCNGPAGQDLPGGFGWLDTVDDEYACYSEIEDGWGGSSVGVAPPCTPLVVAQLLKGPDGTGAVIYVPYFDDKQGTGNTARFHIAGYGAFKVTGYDLQPGSKYEWNSPCAKPNDQVCLGGYFLDGVSIGAGEFGGEYRGVWLVRLID